MFSIQHITLDIETIAGDPSEAEAALRRSFAPNPNWKPSTIGERYLAALETKKERLALLDTAPILSVALRTEQACILIHQMPSDITIDGVQIERQANERELLRRLRDYLLLIDEATILVGHNIRHFDLPRLRLAMLRNGLALPPCLANPEHPIYDTMLSWRYFSIDDRQFISLAECLELAGLQHHKHIISGAEVPSLYAAGEFHAIAAYAVADVLAQDELWRWMSGQVTTDRVGSEATGGHAVIEEAAAKEIAAGPSGTTSSIAKSTSEVDVILQELGFKENIYAHS